MGLGSRLTAVCHRLSIMHKTFIVMAHTLGFLPISVHSIIIQGENLQLREELANAILPLDATTFAPRLDLHTPFSR